MITDQKKLDISRLKIDPEVATIIPAYLAQKHFVLPIKREGNKLILAMVDTMNILAIDDVKRTTGCEVEVTLVSEEELAREIQRFFGIKEYVEKAIEEIEVNTDLNIAEYETREEVEYSPVVKVINSLIAQAVKENASDIHIDPQEDGIKIRFRIDGLLQNVTSPSREVQSLLVTRIKVMAGLDITNKRLPQDGKIFFDFTGYKIDLRVSIVPTIFGEKVVLRLLYKERIIFPLDKLGFKENFFADFIKLINKNTGMILVTGPTGCGKTTTLYSILHHLESTEKNILTVEDPVEYQLKDINQIQIEEKTKMTFARGLRSILRQDPDIIMVGEIRDQETAEIAIRAALTGHLVFSSLHTNSAISTISRLLDMGIAPYLLSSALEGVLSQRLLRLNCPRCTEIYTPSKDELEFYKLISGEKNLMFDFYCGKGCNFCNYTGFKGRRAVYELFHLTPGFKKVLAKNRSLEALNSLAVDEGYVPLIKTAVQVIKKGETTLHEIIRTIT